MVRFLRGLVVATLVGGASHAFAQGAEIALIRDMAANQLGMLEYCQAEGFVGADAVAAQRSNLAELPPAPNPAAADAAEALGKRGSMSMHGTTVTLASMASMQQTTVAEFCQMMGSASSDGSTMGGAGAPGTRPTR